MKRGRHLPAVAAQPFLAAAPDDVGAFAREGWQLTPRMRPYLRSDGRISVRLVLRRGQVTAVFSFQLDAAVLDAPAPMDTQGHAARNGCKRRAPPESQRWG